jgi:peptidoglycan/xylan/chitin deacetylase (PgdA/CDA1 family)
MLAFTFDDGPSDWTLRIADSFAARGGRATFFVIGDAIPGREEVLQAVAVQGHELGNHSTTHGSLANLDRKRLVSELAPTNERIERACGLSPTLLRPPYVQWDDAVLRAAGELGLRWTVCSPAEPPDWEMPSAAEIANAVVARLQPGAIVSLHDGRPAGVAGSSSVPSREPTAQAVEAVLENLGSAFRLVTVSELISAAGLESRA